MSPLDAQITFLYTADFEATTRFYGELLGLPLALDQGGCRIYRVAGGAFVGVCRCDEPPRPDGVILCLVTDDVDAWHARLAEQGVPFDKTPAYNPEYRIYHCFARDPNGYVVEIQRFDDERWQG